MRLIDTIVHLKVNGWGAQVQRLLAVPADEGANLEPAGRWSLQPSLREWLAERWWDASRLEGIRFLRGPAPARKLAPAEAPAKRRGRIAAPFTGDILQTVIQARKE